MPHFECRSSDWVLDGSRFEHLACTKNRAAELLPKADADDVIVLSLSVVPHGYRRGYLGYRAPHLIPPKSLDFILDTGATYTVLRGPKAEELYRAHKHAIIGNTHLGFVGGPPLENVPAGLMKLVLGSRHYLDMMCLYVTPEVLEKNKRDPAFYPEKTMHLLGLSQFFSRYLLSVGGDGVEFFRRHDPIESP